MTECALVGGAIFLRAYYSIYAIARAGASYVGTDRDITARPTFAKRRGNDTRPDSLRFPTSLPLPRLPQRRVAFCNTGERQIDDEIEGDVQLQRARVYRAALS